MQIYFLPVFVLFTDQAHSSPAPVRQYFTHPQQQLFQWNSRDLVSDDNLRL